MASSTIVKPSLRDWRSRWLTAWALAICPIALGCPGAEQPAPAKTGNTAPEAKPVPKMGDDALAERYVRLRARIDAEPDLVTGSGFAELSAALLEIANGAEDPHLRANAALLLGSTFETRKDPKTAAAHYRMAAKLVPDDAGPWMALAVASAAAGDVEAAATAQARATELDPDNLENWLALGELRYRAGKQDEAAKAYAAYEQRRKGIIDGLTLRDKSGNYLIGDDERVGCAEALAGAADAGTGVALSYALAYDTSPKVRAAVATAMGVHRIEGYKPQLEKTLATETDPEAKEAIEWAIAEITRDPVKAELGARSELPADDPRRRTDGEGGVAVEPIEAPAPPTDAPPSDPTPTEGTDTKADGDAKADTNVDTKADADAKADDDADAKADAPGP